MNVKRSLWPKMPAAFVQRNLTGHKILGLAVAGLLYLICLSGTVTVFYLDLQRWEASGVPDATFTPEGVARALTDARAYQAKAAPSISASTPTRDAPRLTLSAGSGHRGYDSRGRFIGPAETPAIDALTALHYQLHLPSTIGVVVVGLGGIAILALVIGGLLAHPRLLKDAFLWRFKAGARANRSELHNRIGVWGAPFHIVIAVTGALIGLIQIIVLVAAIGFGRGDTAATGEALLGSPPPVSTAGRMSESAMITALSTLQHAYPGAEPNYVSLNNLNTPKETLTVWADIPGRLVYGEQFDFDGQGRLTARQHLIDGPAGKQAYASLYRLHFGAFGGVWVRIAYTLLGLGLCLICTTGMDIWLLKAAQKGRPHPRLHRLWTGFVWGAPVAMAAAGAVTLVWPMAYIPAFWLILIGLSAGALFLGSVRQVSVSGRLALATALVGLVAVHACRPIVASNLPEVLVVDAALVVIALIGLGSVFTRR
jgi:uncharacterized iron-regulated membrane protein